MDNGMSESDEEDDVSRSQNDEEDDVAGSQNDEEDDVAGIQIDEEDDVAGSQNDEEDDVAGQQIPFEAESHETGGVSDGREVMDGVEEDVRSDSQYAVDTGNPSFTNGSSENPNELSVTFQGFTYVFDNVPEYRVRAVLQLIETSGVPTMAVESENQQSLNDSLPRPSSAQRAASLNRYREKRKEMSFDKKIRYEVRREVALRMQRKSGRFASSDVNDLDESGQVKQCMHCGINSKLTPMMRRGPAGPKTLCNACGIVWSTKGAVRSIPNAETVGTHTSSVNPKGEASGSDVGNQ